jgi:hypothetical protein
MTLRIIFPIVTVISISAALVACSPRDSRLEPFNESMKAANRAARVIKKRPGYAVMSEADVDEMLLHYREALSHAEKVDTAFLESKYRGRGSHFDSEFRAGLRLLLKANETGDAATSLRGQRLMAAWGEWYAANVGKTWNLQ